MTRVYVPTTVAGLARLQQKGELEAEPGESWIGAHAVTPAVREWYTDGDLEELEYSAMIDAADASIGLLARDPQAPRRRVVLALDVTDGALSPGQGQRSAVRVSPPAGLSRVVSVHIDELESEPVIAAAADAYDTARAGDEDARFLLDEAEGCDLLWYDVTEIDDLVE
jgi:hypothetical protein